MSPVYNFYAGPATLPAAALERARDEMLDFHGLGISVMEISHRSKEYDEVHNEAIKLVSELIGAPDDYKVMFFQGGATLQFSQIPMNLLKNKADYIHTGNWTKKAIAAAKPFGDVNIAGSSEDKSFSYIPKGDALKLDPKADYLHICSNNTVNGTQYKEFPDAGDTPLIADMSSDFLSRPVDAGKFGMIYAGAQKNVGPAGVVVTLISEALLDRCEPADTVPPTMRYKEMAGKNSLMNTPPCFAIYMVRNTLSWLKSEGGLKTIAKRNERKAAMIYDVIDSSGGFYTGHAEKEDRSLMNITFNLAEKELEAKFVEETVARGMIGLKGHRSVGGIRASIYNAMPEEGCKALADFMKDFAAKNG